MVNRGNCLRGSLYQNVVSKSRVELTSESGRYHVAETKEVYQGEHRGYLAGDIERVCTRRCPMSSLVALNLSWKGSKKAKTIELLTHSQLVAHSSQPLMHVLRRSSVALGYIPHPETSRKWPQHSRRYKDRSSTKCQA